MALGNSDEIDQSFVEIRMPKLEGSKDKNDDVKYVLLNCDQLARKKRLAEPNEFDFSFDNIFVLY